MTNKTPEEIMREAEALIRQTEQSLAATDELLRSTGTNPEQPLDAKQKAEAEAMFRQDMEAVEREVAEEAARLRFSNAPVKPAGTRKMRNLI